jgi:hypothetical protein
MRGSRRNITPIVAEDPQCFLDAALVMISFAVDVKEERLVVKF